MLTDADVKMARFVSGKAARFEQERVQEFQGKWFGRRADGAGDARLHVEGRARARQLRRVNYSVVVPSLGSLKSTSLTTEVLKISLFAESPS